MATSVIEIVSGEIAPRACDELHLCNNLRHLMFALADIVGRAANARIIYLEDDAPLLVTLKKRLRDIYPNIDIHYSTDAIQIAGFAGIPFTGILRRNLRFDTAHFLTRATRWCLPDLDGQRFKTGFIYHSGLFTAKPASASCDHIVMRESGLNNYVAFPVPWPKTIVRALSGLRPFAQIWGEERWVDVIEVARPEQLPQPVRAKGRTLTFANLLGRLDKAQAKALGRVFVPVLPVLPDTSAPRAVLLTQPLDTVGLCSKAEKYRIYEQVIGVLSDQGYDVHVKHHPTETAYPLVDCTAFDANFPIELWATLGLPRFDLAVALCSASLMEGEALVANKVVQLIAPAAFNAAGLADWRRALPAGLAPLTV